jgi:3-keto-L-gulonate-6-phosphate decarboxylase/transcriptional regulator with XRE-family HTH domain
MGSVVARWTGREARALREAKRMSVREFAAHLGVNDAAVSNWERRGAEAKLRYDTQQLLDTDLIQSGPEVADRFELILRSEITDEPPAHNAPQAEMATGSATHLGGRSGQRTAVLLGAVGLDVAESTYQPDQVAVERFRQFLDSATRVFVLTGGAGSGKTRLTQHLARQWSGQVDFQFHTCSTWALSATSLATEILRYASLPSGNDGLLSLERASNSLERPCVVVIDGVDSEEQLTVVGRQVDGILRQANSNRLRFIIVARTPPELDLSAFPVLAAATFDRMTASSAASHTMTPWSLAEARALWDRERHDDQMPFADLPESLQSLAGIPLYMQMLRSAGGVAHATTPTGTVNAFHLVDHCVRIVLSRSAQRVEAAMEHLAQLACALTPGTIPGPLTGVAQVPDRASDAADGKPIAPFVEHAPDGRARFIHDVFREYFLAVRIVDQMTARGRSAAMVAGFNELAVHAARSAAARGVFDFVVCALDSSAPNLIEVIALAPSTALDTALPMLLETAATNGALASTEVVRACAHRCTQAPTRQLTRALLATPNLAEVLGDQHAPWVVKQLQIYGFEIWDDIARHVETALDIRVSTRIVERIDMDHAEEAAFLARHFDLFTSTGRDQADVLQQLLHHLDWRVRAGLAEALLGRRTLGPSQVDRIVQHVVRDDDYKVRAAVARAVGTLGAAATQGRIQALLTDHNWHVRERTLQGVLTGRQAPLPDPTLARTVIATVVSDKSWAAPPAPAAKLLARIRLLNNDSSHDPPPPGDPALFGLLREVRSGWIELPPDLEQSLVSCGEKSPHWLTVREARAVQQRHAPHPGVTSAHEQYRRRRGQPSLQVALDVHTLDRAVEIAIAAVDAGADFIEVGDPLIKRAGVEAIETIKRYATDTAVVAEMMSADWGRDQVELAAEAGADVVLLIGPASIASVSAAVAAARRLGVALTLDAPPEHARPSWLRDMERTGIDGFVVTTNIDLGIGGNHPLATARTIRACSQLPVAVSGGFSTADDTLTSSDDWDIAIVGRSVADAVAPADMAHQLTTIVRKIHTEERL